MRTPEGVTKADIKKLLDSYGDELYYHMSVQSGYGKRTVDFLICFRGMFIAAEAKRKGARARKFQERILDQVLNAHGITICIDDADALKRLLSNVARPRT